MTKRVNPKLSKTVQAKFSVIFLLRSSRNSSLNIDEIRLYTHARFIKLAVIVLFQTPRVLSRRVELEDFRLRHSVFHRTQLHHAGDGAA